MFMDKNKNYTVGEFAKLINRSVRTVQRWDKDGILVAKRNLKNRRYYTYEQYLQAIGELPEDNVESENIYIYGRVSNRNQKDDLDNQLNFLIQFANARGYIVKDIFTDIGSGLNYKRKSWNELIDLAIEGKVDKIIIAHKDRFVRFGYEWFEDFLKKNGVEILVVNNEKLSPQEELVQDLISIIHVFSCRIYGLRKYKKEIEADFEKIDGRKE